MKVRNRFWTAGLVLALAIAGLLALGSSGGVAVADPLPANSAGTALTGEQPKAAPIPADCSGPVFGPANNGAGIVFAEINITCDFTPSFFVLSATLRTDLGPVAVRSVPCGGSSFCTLVVQAPCSPGARYQVVAELVYQRPDGSIPRFGIVQPPTIGVTLC
jgi:hypothetical protein